MQLIIVYIIIFFVVVYAVYAIIKSLRKKKNPCDGCKMKAQNSDAVDACCLKK